MFLIEKYQFLFLWSFWVSKADLKKNGKRRSNSPTTNPTVQKNSLVLDFKVE
jgi:hypothetical protein